MKVKQCSLRSNEMCVGELFEEEMSLPTKRDNSGRQKVIVDYLPFPIGMDFVCYEEEEEEEEEEERGVFDREEKCPGNRTTYHLQFTIVVDCHRLLKKFEVIRTLTRFVRRQ